jgi:hypothetical protein
MKFRNILYNVTGYSISSEHQLHNVTPLKTPFGLLLLIFQSQSHVTTFTHNYFLRCYTCTQLTITYTFVTTITCSTLTRLPVYVHYTLIFAALSHIKSPNLLSTSLLADFSAIKYYLKLSHTVAHAKSSIPTASQLRYLLREFTNS